MMRFTVLLTTILFLFMVGCQADNGESNPTLVPTVGASSPREVMTPTATLPATWTPASYDYYGTPVSSSNNNNAGKTSYTVVPGDTLGEIAKKFNVTLQDLKNSNKINNIDQIEVGDVLIIP